MAAIPPSVILSRKGIARYGGVSRIGPLSRRPTLLAHESCRMEFFVKTLFGQLSFLGANDFPTPPVCMVRVCQQLNYLPRDMSGSSCVSLGVFSPLALGVHLFFFWMLCLHSLAVLQVLYLHLRQLVSLHCEACREPFSRSFRHPKSCKSQ